MNSEIIEKTSSEIVKDAEKLLEKEFDFVNDVRDYNQKKVLQAFIDNKVAAEHFWSVSGYGHDDMGREVLDNVFAQVFRAEAALSRPHFVSGTHTLACALMGNLRAGEKLVSVAGTPYDTMQEVIGIRGDKRASLMGYGVLYDEVPLKDEMDIDFELLEKKIDKSVNMVLIQRSRGYSLRKSLGIEVIKRIIDVVKSKNPDCICFVDNCYGEFVEKLEPTDVGADLIAGSLIKNPGGGIVEAGGYIAGKAKYVEQASQRLTAPGIGREGGAMINQGRLIFQGLFMAPSVVSDSVKGAILAARIFEEIGYISTPKYFEHRADIIQTITFNAPEPLEEFCKTLQFLSPVNSYVTPIPDDVPGYDDKLIMAGGSFIEGSTIELSADGPMRPPYAVYMQGGLNYAHVKIVLEAIVDKVK